MLLLNSCSEPWYAFSLPQVAFFSVRHLEKKAATYYLCAAAATKCWQQLDYLDISAVKETWVNTEVCNSKEPKTICCSVKLPDLIKLFNLKMHKMLIVKLRHISNRATL